MVGRREIDDQNEIRILLLDGHAALIDDRRQRRRSLSDAVLHIDRGDSERIADIECDGDRRRAVVRARRRHIGHAGDAVDLLLERSGHRVGDDLRAGARIACAHHDLRRRDVGKLRDRQQEIANAAGKHHDDGDRRCEDRPLDEEADHERPTPWVSVVEIWPGSAAGPSALVRLLLEGCMGGLILRTLPRRR